MYSNHVRYILKVFVPQEDPELESIMQSIKGKNLVPGNQISEIVTNLRSQVKQRIEEKELNSATMSRNDLDSKYENHQKGSQTYLRKM